MVQGGLPQATVQPVAPVAPMPVASASAVASSWSAAADASQTAAAATPLVNVPATVALGEIVLSRDAEAYCASLPRQPATDYGGCRRIKCPAEGDCGWCSCCVAYTYAMPMNEDWLCFPVLCVLFPLPFVYSVPCPFCVSVSERQQNQWILRKSHETAGGEKDCAWVIVDAEKKTIACYDVKYEKLRDKPMCYCVK